MYNDLLTLIVLGFTSADSMYYFQLCSSGRLRRLEQFGQSGEFNQTVDKARKTFEDLPDRVAKETILQRAGISVSPRLRYIPLANARWYFLDWVITFFLCLS